VESLFDGLLAVEVRELPADLAALDRLLADRRLLDRSPRPGSAPPVAMAADDPDDQLRAADGHQAAHRLGDETLVREVSDSLQLRRFCLLPLTARVPDESTVPKLVRRLGPETVAELTRVVIGTAQRETRFVARAVRIDSTVVEADIRYPTDAGLAWQGARVLAREGRKLAGRLGGSTRRVVDRSRRIGKLVRSISRTLVRRTGQRPEDVMELHTQAGRVVARSVAEARALAAQARLRAWPRSPRQAARRWAAGGAGRPLPARRHPDPAAVAGRADPRPAGVAG